MLSLVEKYWLVSPSNKRKKNETAKVVFRNKNSARVAKGGKKKKKKGGMFKAIGKGVKKAESYWEGCEKNREDVKTVGKKAGHLGGFYSMAEKLYLQTESNVTGTYGGT